MIRTLLKFSRVFTLGAAWAKFHKNLNIFTAHLPLQCRQNMHTGGGKLKLPVGLLALSIPFFNKKEDEEKDPIVEAFKRGVLASQKDEYKMSQKFFHQGLDIAAQQHREKKIDDRKLMLIQINAYCRMADIAMRFKDFSSAEKLYKSTIEKCIQVGKSKEDPSVLELLLKLSSLFAMQSRDDEAQVGFSACLKATEALIESEGGLLDSDTNTLALHGLTCQSYARFKMKLKKHAEAVELYKKSLEVAEEVYGALHPQVLVVLNDMASAYIAARKYSDGIKCYKLAIERAKSNENSEESLTSQVAFNYNLGEAYILIEDFTKAQESCAECLSIASKLGNPDLLQAARQCSNDVREVKSKTEKKKP